MNRLSLLSLVAIPFLVVRSEEPVPQGFEALSIGHLQPRSASPRRSLQKRRLILLPMKRFYWFTGKPTVRSSGTKLKSTYFSYNRAPRRSSQGARC